MLALLAFREEDALRWGRIDGEDSAASNDARFFLVSRTGCDTESIIESGI
jgi:hypothetical protein